MPRTVLMPQSRSALETAVSVAESNLRVARAAYEAALLGGGNLEQLNTFSGAAEQRLEIARDSLRAFDRAERDARIVADERSARAADEEAARLRPLALEAVEREYEDVTTTLRGVLEHAARECVPAVEAFAEKAREADALNGRPSAVVDPAEQTWSHRPLRIMLNAIAQYLEQQ